MKHIVAVLLAITLMLLAYLPALAVPPEVIFAEDVDEIWNFGDESGFYCTDERGTFPLMDHGIVHGEIILHKDKNGVPVRLEIVATKGQDNLYTDADPSLVISGTFHWRSTLTDFAGYDANGEMIFLKEKWTGVDWNIQLPGEGTVMHSVGQVRWDYSGQDPVMTKRAGLEEIDLETLCKALGFN